jgi:hypothetical protein
MRKWLVELLIVDDPQHRWLGLQFFYLMMVTKWYMLSRNHASTFGFWYFLGLAIYLMTLCNDVGHQQWASASSQPNRSTTDALQGVVLFFFIQLFTCAYIVWAISLPCSPSPSLLSTPPTSRQNLFCPFLQFYWRVDMSNNKKDKAFLLVEIRIAIQRDS